MLFVPLAGFAALAGLLFAGLYAGDPSRLPSALIGKPVPAFDLPPLPGLHDGAGKPVPGLGRADLTQGGVTLVNVWASWCVPCRTEHPVLLRLGALPGVRLVGIDYKDVPENARRFLGELGNPFAAVGIDQAGRTAIDWGVYGVPETFVVDGRGRIAYKQVGPLTDALVERVLMPEIDKARNAGAAGG
jgi:cytochrome c biogenesis protein CcmG/thiol:disulfide interchange protein DsbE